MKKSSIIKNLTDEQLLSGISERDYAIFTSLYSAYFHNLSMVSVKYVKDVFVAEGIVQEVFIKLWEQTIPLEEVKSLKSYLYRSVINLSINHVNRRKNLEQHHIKIAEKIEEGQIETLHEEQEIRKLIYSEIEKLPSQCKKVFKMSRLEGLKYREIASELGITEKTVENHIVNALKILRQKLLVKGTGKGSDYRLKLLSVLVSL